MAANKEIITDFKPVEEDVVTDFTPVKEVPQSQPQGLWQQYKQNLQDVGTMAKNVPGSAVNFAKNIVTPIFSPVKTAKDLIYLAEGGIDELIPGTFPDKRPYAKAFAQGMVERYGGLENIKKTIMEDPVGFLSDLSTVITGAGGLASKVGTVGRTLEPINVMKQVAKMPMRAIPKEIIKAKSERFYTSALKGMTGDKWSIAKRQKTVERGLQEGIPVTRKGFVKLNDAIDEINSEFAMKVDDLTKGKYTMDPKDIVKTFDELDEFYSHYPAYKFTDELATVKDQFIDKMRTQFPKGIPVDEAQKIKQTIYRIHRKHYGELKGAEIEGNKAIARGIREEFISGYPELRELGIREKEMIDLQQAIAGSLKRIENKDLIGIGTPIVAGVVGATTGHPSLTALAWVAKWTIDNPVVKSKLAIALSKARQNIRISKTATTARQALYQTGQAENMMQQQPEDQP